MTTEELNDELLAENAALRETLGRTLDALEIALKTEGVKCPPGSIIGDARRLRDTLETG